MTQPPSPREPRREYQLPEEMPLSKTGKMEGIKSAKLEEGSRLSEKVPALSPYEGGSFKHKVTYLKSVGGWKAVFHFILSKIFSFFKSSGIRSGTLEEKLSQLKKAGKTRTSPEVQKELKTFFKVDVGALQSKWNQAQKGSFQDVIEFHKEIQSKLDDVDAVGYLTSEETPFIQEEKGVLSKALMGLGDQSDQHLKRVFEQKVAQIQKYPLEDDPLAFFNFYTQLRKSAFETGSKGLNELKDQTKGVLSNRLNERVKSLGLPEQKLDEIAEKAGISLEGKANFGERVAVAREKLQAQLKRAQTPVDESHKAISSLRAQRQELSRQFERDDELKAAIEKREASEIRAYEMGSKDLDREIDSLTDEIAALASETKKKQVKVREQKIAQRSAKIDEKEQLGLEYSKRIKGITTDVERTHQVERLNERARTDLSGRIRILDERLDATRSQLTEQETQLRPIETLLSSLESIERETDHLKSSEISTIVRLFAFEVIFREFQTQNESSTQFFSKLVQSEEFKSVVSQKAHDILGKTEHIDVEIKKALNLLASRNVNPKLAKELGVEEFLAT